MDQLTEFMLDVWRATGRHTDIATLTTHIAQLLGHWVPVQQVLMHRCSASWPGAATGR